MNHKSFVIINKNFILINIMQVICWYIMHMSICINIGLWWVVFQLMQIQVFIRYGLFIWAFSSIYFNPKVLTWIWTCLKLFNAKIVVWDYFVFISPFEGNVLVAQVIYRILICFKCFTDIKRVTTLFPFLQKLSDRQAYVSFKNFCVCGVALPI